MELPYITIIFKAKPHKPLKITLKQVLNSSSSDARQHFTSQLMSYKIQDRDHQLSSTGCASHEDIEGSDIVNRVHSAEIVEDDEEDLSKLVFDHRPDLAKGHQGCGRR